MNKKKKQTRTLIIFPLHSADIGFELYIIFLVRNHFRSGEKKGERKNSSPTNDQRLSTMAEEEEHNSEQTKKTTSNNLSQV